MSTNVPPPVPASRVSDWERHTHQDKELVKGLGLTSATMLVMGSMIGSGIFIVSAEISREVASPALLIGAWLVTGFLTIVGALTYGELAAMMPRAGGQYVYLRESLGPLWGFLYGWTLFLVIQTGTIAAVGRCVRQIPRDLLAGNLLQSLDHPPLESPEVRDRPHDSGRHGCWTEHAESCRHPGSGRALDRQYFRSEDGRFHPEHLHHRESFGAARPGRLRSSSWPQRAGGGREFRRKLLAQFGPWHFARRRRRCGGSVLVSTLTVLAIAQVGSLFSADAWNNVTFTAGEVKNPSRNLPLSLALGTGVVIALYIACNFIYLSALPLVGSPTGATLIERGIQYASEDRVATAVMTQMFGSIGGKLMAVAIMISCFGCCNGLILAGARVYYAMAKDGLFFRGVARLHPSYKTPAVSLMVQMAWTCVLCISGSYGQLLDYIIFAVLVFYILTIFGLFVLRRTHPEAERPYKAIGYPVLPAIYIVMALFIDVVLLRYKPQYTWPGLIIVLLGIPVYYIWRPRSANA